jgi:hypothetical protein
MSLVLDAASAVHSKQIGAVNRVEPHLVGAAGKAAGAVGSLREKAALPEAVAGPVQKVTAPVTKVVGTPTEVAAYAVATAREWTEAQHRLQSALLDAVAAPQADPQLGVVEDGDA